MNAQRSHRSRPRPTAGSVAPAGLTLVELLFTMGLLALVLGVGLGSVSRLDLGRGTAASLVESTLRATGNWAASRRAPARVGFDLERGLVRAEGLDVVGTWAFESIPIQGAFDLVGSVYDLELVEDGFVGRALGLAGAPSEARFQAPVHTDPAWDFSAGFRVQLALRPEVGPGGRILRIGEAFALDGSALGGLVVAFAAQRLDESGRRVSAGLVRASVPDGALPLGRWSRVLVSYDRRQLAVFVEGVPVATVEESALVAPVEGPLVIGGGRTIWSGSVDSLVVSAVAVDESVVLPRGVRFGPGMPAEVVFAPGGSLDRSVHSGPVEVPLIFADGSLRTLRVNLYGTVE